MNSEEMSEQSNIELYRLRKDFKSLTFDHQKWVLKMALGLLRVQRACKAVATDKAWNATNE